MTSCHQPSDNYKMVVPSPNGQILLHFNLYNGEPYYLIYSHDEIVVDWSWLGFSGDSLATLQKQMLVANTHIGSESTDDELSLFSDKESIRYEATLQKQNHSELEYKIVFKVYDEALVLWYEFDKSLYSQMAKMKEASELDLYSGNQNWTLEDTIAMDDYLHFPVSFQSDENFHLTIDETNAKDRGDNYLLQRKSGLPEFDIHTLPYTDYYEECTLPHIIKTQKIIIRIHRNIK